MDETQNYEYSRVRCDGFWFEVLECAPEVTELLNHGDDDWVELSGKPDGRPIWLRASLVDYAESASFSAEESAKLDAWIERVMKTIPAGCAGGGRWAPVRSFRTRKRSWCSESWSRS